MSDNSKPVAYSLRWPDDDPRLCLSTVFDTEADAKEWADRCQGPISIVPLYEHPPVEPVKEADVSDEVLTDDQIEDIWAAVSPFDGEVDMIEYARKIESAVVLALRGGTP